MKNVSNIFRLFLRGAYRYCQVAGNCQCVRTVPILLTVTTVTQRPSTTQFVADIAKIADNWLEITNVDAVSYHRVKFACVLQRNVVSSYDFRFRFRHRRQPTNFRLLPTNSTNLLRFNRLRTPSCSNAATECKLLFTGNMVSFRAMTSVWHSAPDNHGNQRHGPGKIGQNLTHLRVMRKMGHSITTICRVRAQHVTINRSVGYDCIWQHITMKQCAIISHNFAANVNEMNIAYIMNPSLV